MNKLNSTFHLYIISVLIILKPADIANLLKNKSWIIPEKFNDKVCQIQGKKLH